MSNKVAKTHVPCTHISREDNELIFNLVNKHISSMSFSLCTVMAEICMVPKNQSTWRRLFGGALCFEKDYTNKSYFFRLYCLERQEMMWEHEAYKGMDVYMLCPFLMSFEGEFGMIGINFAFNDEANMFSEAVSLVINKAKASSKRIKKMEKLSKTEIGTPMNFQVLSSGKNPKESKSSPKKVKGKLTVADIGTPCDFQHVKHVGSKGNVRDPLKTIDIQIVPELVPQVRNIGAPKEVMRLDSSGHVIEPFKPMFASNLKENALSGGPKPQGQIMRQPPPRPINLPPRPDVTQKPAPAMRLLPKIPDSPQTVRRDPPRLPPGPPRSIAPRPSVPAPSVKFPSVPLPALPSSAPLPPPPPPMLMPIEAPTSDGVSKPRTMPPSADPRGNLLQSIQMGVTLKNSSEREIKPVVDSRDNLLQSIQKGVTLKKASERVIKAVVATGGAVAKGGSNIMSGLQEAMMKRAEKTRESSDEEEGSDDEVSDDDEWD